MVELFDRHRVSFVSVTQQFNTTTSMGRLMLNILLSFAQFEREVTGERIRDKIAASKRKGIWMGGVPPLGYDVRDRRLVPNSTETQLIQHIFCRFIALGSSTLLVKELQQMGATSKSWTTQNGQVRQGKPIDKSLIYKLLNNRLYLGELRHQSEWYPGEHAALIDQTTWDNVQAILAVNRRVRGNHTRATVPFLLKGLLFDPDGRALSPWQTVKKSGGRCYRYYIPQRDAKEYAGASGVPRLPAAQLEKAVFEQLRSLLGSPDLISPLLAQAQQQEPTLDEAQVTVAMTQLDSIWAELFPAEQARIFKLLIEKVMVSADTLEVRLRPTGLVGLVGEITQQPLAPSQGVAA